MEDLVEGIGGVEDGGESGCEGSKLGEVTG